MVDRDSWTPPPTPTRQHQSRVPGAMGGSLLLDLPQYAPLKAELAAFIDQPGPLAVEVGFDHGITLLDHARCFPTWRWLGVEIREKQVLAVRPNAPPNCLPLRLDARTLLSCGLLNQRVDRVDVRFPTPALKGRHLLWTPAFVADLAACLRPGGVVTIATDVPALATLIADLFAGWKPVAAPPRGAALSRRERVCQRDGVAVWWGSFEKVPGVAC